MFTFQQISEQVLVPRQVFQMFGVSQCELERGQSVIEADQTDRARNVPRCLKHRQRISRRSQPDIPNDERMGRRLLKSITQPSLGYVKCLGFGHRANHRVKGLGVGQGVNAMGAVREFHDAVTCAG